VLESSMFDPHTFLGRVARYPLRLLPATSVMPILRGPLRGKKWIVSSQRHAFWLGSYEPEMQRLFVKVVKPGGVFYDIGANVGFYSLLASQLVGTGKVFAFEPSPENIRYMRRHLDINRCDNVEILDLAICDREGYAYFAEDRTGSMGRLEGRGELQVRTSTLDALLRAQNIPPPDYLKMDIEGAEFQALRGARHCFQQYKPVLFLATHGREVHRSCCELLNSWGYKIEFVRQQSEDRAEVFATYLSIIP
jgi:FkbM family methyltransferase